MMTPFTTALEHPWVQVSVAIGLLALGFLFGTFIVRRLLLLGINRLLNNTPFGKDEQLRRHKVIPRLANIVPALIVTYGVTYANDIPLTLVLIIQNVSLAFITLSFAMAISGAIAIVDTVYHRNPENRLRPIKGYLQILRIAIYLVAAILILSILIDKSPVILLSGLGAMAAVLILVFQDTLLSFVASIQITMNDTVRVGDWIEMPEFNADGDVIEIALHTVRVQNWDKTITTIPIRNMVSDSFRNWRSMQDGGGRRIKRSILIDKGSISFLDDDVLENLGQVTLLQEYLAGKRADIKESDSAGGHVANQRQLTNVGTFRAYLKHYLKSHPCIRSDMTLLVRQLAPTAQGLPIEIYCFTNTVAWDEYEAIQSDIFDHALSIIGVFGLSLYQEPSGRDIHNALANS